MRPTTMPIALALLCALIGACTGPQSAGGIDPEAVGPSLVAVSSYVETRIPSDSTVTLVQREALLQEVFLLRQILAAGLEAKGLEASLIQEWLGAAIPPLTSPGDPPGPGD